MLSIMQKTVVIRKLHHRIWCWLCSRMMSFYRAFSSIGRSSIDNFRRMIRSDLKKLPTQNPPPARVGPSTMLVKALNDASKSQRKLGDAFIALDTLIASLFGIDSQLQRALKGCGATYEEVKKVLKNLRGGRKVDSQRASNRRFKLSQSILKT